MSVVINYGAIKFKSIRAAAKVVAKKSGEPVERVYMRLYMRKRNAAKRPLWSKPRKYTMQTVETNVQVGV